MKLVKATEADRTYCAKLSIANMTPYYERWGEPAINEAQWFQLMALCDVYLVAPESGGPPVGFVSVQIDPTDPKALFVADTHIEPAYQNEGVLVGLEPLIVGLMRERGATAITGSVHRDNPIVFSYEKRGSHKVGITSTRYKIKKEYPAEQLQEI